MSRRICVVTGTRAEFGLLRPLVQLVADDSELDLRLVVTGMHLSPEFGLTYQEIEQAGFTIDEKIEILLSSDSPVGISKSMGLALIGLSEAFERLHPDMLVVLGDRFELFISVAAALVARIPVAHIHGGEITQGAFDDALRHSITKMSQLHFTSTESYRNRVIQLGESPERVFNVGAIGLDNILGLDLLPREKLETTIGFSLGKRSMLLTFHPVTLEQNTSEIQFAELLEAIDEFDVFRIIFTKANADTHGRVINKMIDRYVAKHPDRAIVFTSMGRLLYLSAMQNVDVVVGNSSSGIIEAPSFHVPTINIGDRQKGRVKSRSIIDVYPKKESIVDGINLALSNDFINSIRYEKNPYEKNDTALNIKKIIKKFNIHGILKKEFYNIPTLNS